MWLSCEPRRRPSGYGPSSAYLPWKRRSPGKSVGGLLAALGDYLVEKSGDVDERQPQAMLKLGEAGRIAGVRQELLEAGGRGGRVEGPFQAQAQDLRQIIKEPHSRD